MQLVEAVGVALEARYALGPHSRGRAPKQLKTRMARLEKKFGSRRAAAAATGIPYSTWGHMLGGRRVSDKNMAKISAGWQKYMFAPARALRVKKVGYPDVWSILAVVVADPGPPEKPKKRSNEGSRYVNGHGGGVTREEAAAMSGDEDDPGFRIFNAEGLDSKRIVDSWLTQGAGVATAALLDEIEQTYGTRFGFEGDHVDVAFHKR